MTKSCPFLFGITIGIQLRIALRTAKCFGFYECTRWLKCGMSEISGIVNGRVWYFQSQKYCSSDIWKIRWIQWSVIHIVGKYGPAIELSNFITAAIFGWWLPLYPQWQTVWMILAAWVALNGSVVSEQESLMRGEWEDLRSGSCHGLITVYL